MELGPFEKITFFPPDPLVVGRWLLIRWLLVVNQLVHNKGSRALGGFPPKGFN